MRFSFFDTVNNSCAKPLASQNGSGIRSWRKVSGDRYARTGQAIEADAARFAREPKEKTSTIPTAGRVGGTEAIA